MLINFAGLVSAAVFLWLYQAARESAKGTGNNMAFQDNAWGWPIFVDRDFGRTTMISAGVALTISIGLFILSGFFLPWSYPVGTILTVLGIIANWIGFQKPNIIGTNRLIVLGSIIFLAGIIILARG